MSKAKSLIHFIAECQGDCQCSSCHCEDNSQHVLHGAKMDEYPYVPDDKNTSGQASNNAGVRRKSIQDIIDIRYVKGS